VRILYELDIRLCFPRKEIFQINFQYHYLTIDRFAAILVLVFIGESSYFVIWKIRPGRRETEKKKIIKNPFRQAEKGKGNQAARFLVRYHIDKVAAGKKLH